MKKVLFVAAATLTFGMTANAQFFKPDPSYTGTVYQDGHTNLIGVSTKAPSYNVSIYTTKTQPLTGVLDETTTQGGLNISNIEKYDDGIFAGSTNNPSIYVTRQGSYVPPYDPDQTSLRYNSADFIVNGMGNTGVGTGTPTAKLHSYVSDGYTDGFLVNGNTWTTHDYGSTPLLYTSYIGNTAIGCFGNSGHDDAYGQLAVQSLYKEEYPMWISTYAGDPYKMNPNLVVDASGRVGISTSTPSYTLDVIGDGNVDATMHVGAHSKVGNLNVDASLQGAYAYGAIVMAGNDNLKALAVDKSTGDKFVVFGDGRTVIGTVSSLPTDYMLFVQKGIITEKLKVAISGSGDWMDRVFDQKYELQPLSAVENYIAANHHLPDVPSAEEVACDGIDVAKMDATLLRKIEELTLYTIKLQKEVEMLKSQK
ncbi:MAG: hypothetical protein JST90_17895 [Bacteroidetes bacterium]|nr:hypothetical protein [Bacteroidota bacterium]